MSLVIEKITTSTPRLFFWFLLCLLLVSLFVMLVLVRITTPRFKLETLSKLGWGASLTLIACAVLVFWLGFFLF